jgi:hypothetical protein
MTSFTKWHSTTRGIAFNIPTHNEGGALNLSTIRNAENKEIILKDIQTFIENEVTALDLSDKNMDNKVLQELVAFKYFFNNPLVSKPTANIREEFDNFNAFSGDECYLVNDCERLPQVLS